MTKIYLYHAKESEHDHISFKTDKSDFTMILWQNRIIKRARNGYMSVEDPNKSIDSLKTKQKRAIAKDLFVNASFWSGEPI